MKVLYIDPQSIYNLAQYDYNLLNNVNAEITYCCNVKYDAKILDKVNLSMSLDIVNIRCKH